MLHTNGQSHNVKGQNCIVCLVILFCLLGHFNMMGEFEVKEKEVFSHFEYESGKCCPRIYSVLGVY